MLSVQISRNLPFVKRIELTGRQRNLTSQHVNMYSEFKRLFEIQLPITPFSEVFKLQNLKTFADIQTKTIPTSKRHPNENLTGEASKYQHEWWQN